MRHGHAAKEEDANSQKGIINPKEMKSEQANPQDGCKGNSPGAAARRPHSCEGESRGLPADVFQKIKHPIC